MMINEVVLSGFLVRLEPLLLEHKNAIAEAVTDGELYKPFYSFVPAPEKVVDYIQTAASMREKDGALSFAIFDKANSQLIGSTRLFRFEPQHKRLEIGYTWYRSSYQEKGYNLDCKLLLLSHCFEEMDLNAVEFRTDFFNFSSRRAIEKLGAKLDGILRNHMVMPNGRIRQTVVYSVVKDEWLAVKENLLFRLERHLKNCNNPS